MKFYVEDIPKQFRAMNRTYGSISVKHEMSPFRPIDVVVRDETQKWRMTDIVTVSNAATGEHLQFQMEIADIPYRASTGYMIRGVKRQLIDLYEMSKGWHFDEGLDNTKKVGDPAEKRLVKFIPDTSLVDRATFFSFSVRNGRIVADKGNRSVPLGVFLKALTGLSYNSIMQKLGVKNRYLLASFAGQEPSRVQCVDQANVLFAAGNEKIPKDASQYLDKRASVVPDTSKIVSFVNKFVGEGTMIGNGSERVVEMFTFRSVKNSFLAKEIRLGGRTLEVGTKLIPELLLELDYSDVNELHCQLPDSNRVYIFRKFEVYNFRGLNRGAADTVEQMRAAENRGELEYTLSTGEVVRRLPAPMSNTVDIIFNVLVLYVNFLNGFNINSNVYDMTNQSVVPIEAEISKLVYERLTEINLRAAELLEQDGGEFSVNYLPVKLVPFDMNTLIDRYAYQKGKTVPLANTENSLGLVAQDHMIVKDVTHSQGAMVTIQDTQIGRMDPFDAPENKNVGLSHNRTFLSRVRSNSQLEAPFVQVSDGKVVSGVIYLSAAAERDQYIGQWNEDFTKDITIARFNGVMVKVPPSRLNYLEANCFQHMSISRALSPFPECMAGKRATMSSSQAKQAIAIVGAERPIINSGAESLIGALDVSSKPFITARDLIHEYCMTHGLDFEQAKDEVVTYEKFDDDGNDRIHVLSFAWQGAPSMISKRLPNYQPTSQRTIYGYAVNAADGMRYSGGDIVFHSLTYDPRKHPRNDSINEGALKHGSGVYDTGLALGLNLHVGYMTYEGSTIDDAIVINDRLVTEDRLSSVFIYQEDYEIKRFESKIEQFGVMGGRTPDGYSPNGLPLIGTHLAPGSVVIHKYVTKIGAGAADLGTGADGEGYQTNIELPPTVGGQVVSAKVTDGNKAAVTIVSLAKMEVGDKMAGRYGNKGVVAKIVPNHLMYYDPETGQPFDIILNPLGIPSRINVSQVLEVTYAACNKKQGTVAVVTPFQQGFIDKIKKDAEALGVKPIRPINPKTGLRTEYAVHVGEIYMYKLLHTVAGKISSIGVTNEVDPIFKQPTGTGPSAAKGQAFGELESWCTMSAECYEFLEEVQTILSEDYESRKDAQEQIEDKPGPADVNSEKFKNSNGKHLTMFFKASGVKLQQSDGDMSEISFLPMTNDDIQNLNPMNPISLNDAKNSLRSARIFSDGQFTKDDVWSWIPLGGDIVSPFWIERGRVHRCIVVYHQQGVTAKASVIRPLDIERIIRRKLWVDMVETSGAARWFLTETPGENSVTGMSALTEMFVRYDLSESEQYYEKLIEKDNMDLDFAAILATIRDLKTRNGLADYVINCFPVIPIRYRPLPMHTLKQQDFDFFYTAIARSAAVYQASGSDEELARVYDYIQLFLGIASEAKKKELMKDKTVYVDLKTFMTNKQSDGRFREMMAKKRVHRSGRSVIVPFGDMTRPPSKIGLPYYIAIDIFGLELSSLLRKSWKEPFGNINSEREAQKTAAAILKNAVVGNDAWLDGLTGPSTASKSAEIKKMIRAFVEQQVVVFGRQPSLHKFGMRAFKPVLVEGKSIHVHPLVCTGFNADFDGDTGYVIAPLTQKSVEEVWKTLSVMNGVVNPGTGKIIIEPSQDIVLGIYYATALAGNSLTPDAGNVVPLCYRELGALLADLELGLIRPGQWVTLRHGGQRYLSTAGRIAFNSILPGGFTNRAYVNKYGLGVAADTFKALRCDFVVSGRVSDTKLYYSISSLVRELYDEYCETENGRETLINHYQRISEFGFRWSERSGISFNLGDLEQSPLIEDFLKAAATVSAEIDRKFEMGLMTIDDRRKAIMEIYAEVRSGDFLKRFVSGLGRTNNIFMMFDSKAKGSEDQIMQTCGMLGVLQKTKNATIDVPITANYSRGLSSFDMFETAYAARLGLLSTIMETQKPGELTRTLVYSFAGLFVANEGCGREAEPYRIRYERNSDFIFSGGERVASSHFVGASIEDGEVLNYDRVCGGTGLVTEQLFAELKYSGIPWFETDRGRVEFDVSLPAFLKKLLLYRTLRDLSYGDLIKRQYISSRTLAEIESLLPRTLDVSLIINCLCEDGICADSYGLRYDSLKTVRPGTFVGIEAAQSIGEPSAQLTMNLANQGGKAGESIGDGISVMMAAIMNGKLKVNNYCLCAPLNGYVSIDKKALAIVGANGERAELNIRRLDTELLVSDGSYVTIGQKLTKGMIHPVASFAAHSFVTGGGRVYDLAKAKSGAALINPSAALIAQVRYEIARFYDYVYSESRINILGRHFEIAAYMQTSHGTVLASDVPEFVVGRSYSVGKLAAADGVDFIWSLQDAPTTIARNAGPIAATCFQDAYGVISQCVWDASKKERSPLSAVLTGSQITKMGTEIKNITDEVDYLALKYVKPVEPARGLKSNETPVVFTFDDDELNSIELLDDITAESAMTDDEINAELNALFGGMEQDAEQETAAEEEKIGLMDKF